MSFEHTNCPHCGANMTFPLYGMDILKTSCPACGKAFCKFPQETKAILQAHYGRIGINSRPIISYCFDKQYRKSVDLTVDKIVNGNENIKWKKTGRLFAKLYFKMKTSIFFIKHIFSKRKIYLSAVFIFLLLIYNFCFRYSYSISSMEGNQTVFLQWKFDSLTDNVYFRVFTFGHFTDWQNAKFATIKPKSSQQQ